MLPLRPFWSPLYTTLSHFVHVFPMYRLPRVNHPPSPLRHLPLLCLFPPPPPTHPPIQCLETFSEICGCWVLDWQPGINGSTRRGWCRPPDNARVSRPTLYSRSVCWGAISPVALWLWWLVSSTAALDKWRFHARLILFSYGHGLGLLNWPSLSHPLPIGHSRKCLTVD